MAQQIEAASGVAERWAVYTQAVLKHVIITLEFAPDQSTVHLVATAPGFDGWVLPLVAAPELLSQLTAALETWLEYRLANHLHVPILPGIETPTLADFEEYDSLRAYDQGQKLLQEDSPRPMDDVFAAIDAGR